MVRRVYSRLTDQSDWDGKNERTISDVVIEMICEF